MPSSARHDNVRPEPGSDCPILPPSEFNLYNASVSVSYTISLSGGFLRALEGLQAQVDYQKYQSEAA